ncbi:MAG TPA: N-6 DNA methylase, partial [Nitrospira sp.]|nr:N-6 DNA methylase [Nitrospira sp.]
MTRRVRHQQLPAAGPVRESLREKGQFWTPAWVAEPMVGYVMEGQADELFDPAVGEGAFFRAAKDIAQEQGRSITLMGAETDPDVLRQAVLSGLAQEDLAAVRMHDFVTHPPMRHFKAIVANPPYIRHHRLPLLLKAELKEYSRWLIGAALDGRAGLHVYFLLRALELLDNDGRLAFIMPADTCEGKFAPALWQWITAHYQLEAVVTFTPEATPFPSVDTNAIVFMIRKAPPRPVFPWARCAMPDTPAFKQWVLSGFHGPLAAGMTVHERQLDEALRTGLSRPPVGQQHTGPVLADFAKVMRGIATGENDFFFLTATRARELRIPAKFLRIAIGRTRDVMEDELTQGT